MPPAIGAAILPYRLYDLDGFISRALVAGVFHPIRCRVQRAVDRRFNRRRYDAVKIRRSACVCGREIDLAR